MSEIFFLVPLSVDFVFYLAAAAVRRLRLAVMGAVGKFGRTSNVVFVGKCLFLFRCSSMEGARVEAIVFAWE